MYPVNKFWLQGQNQQSWLRLFSFGGQWFSLKTLVLPDPFWVWRKFAQLLGFLQDPKAFSWRSGPIMSETERLPNTINLAFVEGLYLDYLKDPLSVPAEWRAYFDQLSNSDGDSGTPRLGPSLHPPSISNPSTVSGNDGFGAR